MFGVKELLPINENAAEKRVWRKLYLYPLIYIYWGTGTGRRPSVHWGALLQCLKPGDSYRPNVQDLLTHLPK